MKIKRWTWAGGVFLAGMLSFGMAARADVYIPSKQGQSAVPTIHSMDDIVSNVPVLGRLTRSFLIGDGFKFKLSGTELRIDHMATHSQAPVSQRHCMLSINFISPVAFFGSSLEMPLLHAANLDSKWGFHSFGDYVAHFSKDSSVQHATIGLKIAARF